MADDFDSAVLTIRPLPTSKGQFGPNLNFWTAEVQGWGISAPTKPELVRMLRDWFADKDSPNRKTENGDHHGG